MLSPMSHITRARYEAGYLGMRACSLHGVLASSAWRWQQPRLKDQPWPVEPPYSDEWLSYPPAKLAGREAQQQQQQLPLSGLLKFPWPSKMSC